MIKNDHMAFQVSNMDASIRFYTEALGLKLLFRHVNEEVREDYAFLELDGGNLELLQYLGAPFVKPRVKPPYCPHLALATGDMDETLRLFTEHGIPVVKGSPGEPGRGEVGLCQRSRQQHHRNTSNGSRTSSMGRRACPWFFPGILLLLFLSAAERRPRPGRRSASRAP